MQLWRGLKITRWWLILTSFRPFCWIRASPHMLKKQWILEMRKFNLSLQLRFLRIEIDNKLNFNNHINTICRSAANQLNALIRLRHFLETKERKALIQSFVLSNFNYCPLVWTLSSVKSLNKIENLQKRVLRFMPWDYESSYDELLRLSGSCAMNVRLKRNLCVEIYKTLNDLNSLKILTKNVLFKLTTK